MEKLSVKIIKGESNDNKKIFFGGMRVPIKSWEEYLNKYEESDRKRINLIKEAIKKEGFLGVAANRFCNYHYFQFSDGVQFGFTWRAWGDLMAAIVGKGESYIDYYMDVTFIDEEE